jgi:hypothetical protein
MRDKDCLYKDQNWLGIGWCSLVMMVVIFFINAHMLIPTITAINNTKDEQS